MRDETPDEPFRETPAPERPDEAPAAEPAPASAGRRGRRLDGPVVPPGSTWRGVRALLLIVGGLTVLELLLYGTARYVDGARYEESFDSSQKVVVLAGLIATIVAAVRLPPPARSAFFASCGILAGAVFLLAVVTCGVLVMTL